jgi:outer membrane protein assembly factor BamB
MPRRKVPAATTAVAPEHLGPHDRLPAAREYTAGELQIWRDGRRGIRFGVHAQSQPVLITPDRRVTAAFSRGEVRSVRAASGSRSWVHSERPYAVGWAAVDEDIVVTLTHGLVRLDRRGRPVWVHAPYPEKGEWIYTAPTVSGSRVFYGDRRGYLNCLDAETGQPAWSVLTSKARNNDVNATAAAWEDRVIVATNSRKLLCFEQATGKRIWEQRLDYGCIWPVVVRNGHVWVNTDTSLYEASPETGEIAQRVRKPGHGIVSFEVCGDTLLVVLCPSTGQFSPTGVPAHLVGIRHGEEVFRRQYAQYVHPDLTFVPETGWVYESGPQGIGIIDPRSGQRLASIREFGMSPHGYPDNMTTAPAVEGNTIYVATSRGAIWALRHPDVGVAP